MSDSPIDLTYLAQQQKQILTELAGLRDDMGVLTAIALRVDGTQSAMLNEIRAMHSQHARVVNRVRDLEGQRP